MTAMPIPRQHWTNPPLPFSPKAVVSHLQHHATNGPAYVQLGATKALARILGLYDQTRDLAKRMAEPRLIESGPDAKPKKKKLSRIHRAQILARGEDPPPEEDEEEAQEQPDPL